MPSLSVNGSLHLFPEEKADPFNKFFANQCSTPGVAKIPPLPMPSEQLQFQCIPEERVSLPPQKLNAWKATGLDQISNRLLSVRVFPLFSRQVSMNAQKENTVAMAMPHVPMLMETTHVHQDHLSLEIKHYAQVSVCIF